MAKVAFNKRKTLYPSKLDLNLRRKLVECNIWSIALLKLGHFRIQSFEM
jgi:hypothetical protein